MNTLKPRFWQKRVEELDQLDLSNSGYENGHLIIWMRASPLPVFRKLYAKIDRKVNKYSSTLPQGKYRIYIQYNYPVSSFRGRKSFVIANTSIFGHKNNIFVFIYVLTGAILCFSSFAAYRLYQYDKKMYTKIRAS